MERLKIIGALVWAASFMQLNVCRAETPEVRAAWQDARAAIRAGQYDMSFDRQLRRYALFPYLQAESILAALSRPDAAEAAIEQATEFLQQHAGTAIEDTFRRDLLFVLSDLQRWEDFVLFYSPAVANEARECEYLSARVDLGQTTDLAPLVTRRWLTPNRLNSACERAFEWARGAGVIDADLIAQRVELLLESGRSEFAGIIAQRLPDSRAEAYLQWARLLGNPLASIDAITSGAEAPLHEDVLPAVWARASTNAPMQALERLAGILEAAPDEDLATELLRDLALGLAWDRRSEALDVFARLPWNSHDDYSLGWLTRAALWSDDWELADRALDSLSSATSQESGWRYWRARVLEKLGEHTAGEHSYAGLLGKDNYYSAIAAARLETLVVPNDQPITAPAEMLEELAELPEFVRARELLLLDERVLATREWRYATAELETAQLVAAVLLASEWNWHDQAVATASRAEIFFDYRLLYPQPFAAEISSAAVSQALDRELLSGLIRQESMFRSDAVSSAGALGLAQLGIGTARDTARALGIAQPTRDDLFDAATNARLGAATLRGRLAQFDEQLPVALAAYNAGPAAASRWLPAEPMDSDIWIENIPYNETREYVRRVLWNSIVYAWLSEDRAPVDTRYLLGSVLPQ